MPCRSAANDDGSDVVEALPAGVFDGDAMAAEVAPKNHQAKKKSKKNKNKNKAPESGHASPDVAAEAPSTAPAPARPSGPPPPAPDLHVSGFGAGTAKEELVALCLKMSKKIKDDCYIHVVYL